jgi:hypothetical protein
MSKNHPDQTFNQFNENMDNNLKILMGHSTDSKSLLIILFYGVFGALIIFLSILIILIFYICVRKKFEDNLNKKTEKLIQRMNNLMMKIDRIDENQVGMRKPENLYVEKSKFVNKISTKDFVKEKEFDKIYEQVLKEEEERSE